MLRNVYTYQWQCSISVSVVVYYAPTQSKSIPLPMEFLWQPEKALQIVAEVLSSALFAWSVNFHPRQLYDWQFDCVATDKDDILIELMSLR